MQLFEVAFDCFELLAFHAGGVLHRAIDHLDEAGNDGERAIDVVKDAGVNLAFGAGEFLLNALDLNLVLQRFEPIVRAVKFDRGLAFPRGPADRRAHRGNIEGLVQVIARAEAKGAPRCLHSLVGREHHDLNVRVEVFEGAEEIDAGHALHQNIEDRDIDRMFHRDGDPVFAVAGDEHFIVILKNDPERLPRSLFVVHDQQRRLASRFLQTPRCEPSRWTGRGHRGTLHERLVIGDHRLNLFTNAVDDLDRLGHE